jgi:hypothetical protein
VVQLHEVTRTGIFCSLLHRILHSVGLTTPGSNDDNLSGMRGYCNSDLEKDDEKDWCNVPATSHDPQVAKTGRNYNLLAQELGPSLKDLMQEKTPTSADQPLYQAEEPTDYSQHSRYGQ